MYMYITVTSQFGRVKPRLVPTSCFGILLDVLEYVSDINLETEIFTKPFIIVFVLNMIKDD